MWTGSVPATGMVTFANGADESSSYIGDGNLLSVGGNISFATGSGRDLNTVFSAQTRVNGSITVRNAAGDSDCRIVHNIRLSSPHVGRPGAKSPTTVSWFPARAQSAI
jgi:hypothetical protein